MTHVVRAAASFYINKGVIMASDPVLAEQHHYKRHMPSVATVVKYWRTHPQPWMKGVVIGWNIPFCFACGWIPLVKIHDGFKWKDISRFLERAHLQDHCECGNDRPWNIVLLCPLCHSAMPRFTSRKKALHWVSERYSHRMQRSMMPHGRSTQTRIRVVIETISASCTNCS